MRVSAYSSAVNRPLHVPRPHTDLNPSEPDDKIDALRATSSIQHFHDKLLLIKDRLKVSLNWGLRFSQQGMLSGLVAERLIDCV